MFIRKLLERGCFSLLLCLVLIIGFFVLISLGAEGKQGRLSDILSLYELGAPFVVCSSLIAEIIVRKYVFQLNEVVKINILHHGFYILLVLLYMLNYKLWFLVQLPLAQEGFFSFSTLMAGVCSKFAILFTFLLSLVFLCSKKLRVTCLGEFILKRFLVYSLLCVLLMNISYHYAYINFSQEALAAYEESHGEEEVYSKKVEVTGVGTLDFMWTKARGSYVLD